MKQSEIDKAVNDWTDGFGGSTVEIAQLKKDVAAISFRAGAEMVNQKQPYSREDMIAFLSWVQYNGFIYNSDSGVWISESMEFSGCAYSDDELLKLWEETK